MQPDNYLETIGDVLKRFISVFEHDFKNLANSLQLNHRALLKIAPDPEKEILTELLFSTRSIEHLLNHTLCNLQALSTLPSHPFSLHFIDEGIEEAIEKYPFTRNQKSCVKLNLTNNFFYKGDPQLTENALFNLLDYALKHLRAKGRGEICITLHSAETGFHQLVFEETAGGLSAKEASQLFEPFAPDKLSMQNIGFLFCRQLMAAYGGRITCESEENLIRFKLLFPKIELPSD